MKRPYVISLLNPKGGTGKSTLAINIACGLRLRGHSVGLLDTDPQRSAYYWQFLRFPRLIEAGQLGRIVDDEGQFPVVLDRSRGIDRQAFRDLEFDFVVIDGYARLDHEYHRLTKASDLVLIPVRPTPLDIWGVAEFVAVIKAHQREAGGHPEAAFIVSMVTVGTKLEQGADRSLAPYDLPVMQGRTSQRGSYQLSITRGLSVLQYQPKGRAAAEITAITDEVLERWKAFDTGEDVSASVAEAP